MGQKFRRRLCKTLEQRTHVTAYDGTSLPAPKGTDVRTALSSLYSEKLRGALLDAYYNSSDETELDTLKQIFEDYIYSPSGNTPNKHVDAGQFKPASGTDHKGDARRIALYVNAVINAATYQLPSRLGDAKPRLPEKRTVNFRKELNL